LYRDPSQLAPEHNVAFLRQCVERFPALNFAAASSGRIYACIVKGAPAWADAGALRNADAETRAALAAVAPALFDLAPSMPERPMLIASAEKIHTLGIWGQA